MGKRYILGFNLTVVSYGLKYMIGKRKNEQIESDN
jgi:hypothetical protein